MEPWMWYLYGIMPGQSLPMNVGRYLVDNVKPTPKGVMAGMAGSAAVGAGIGWKYPVAGEALAYLKLRSLGFGIEGIHPGYRVLGRGGGLTWRAPLLYRLAFATGMYTSAALGFGGLTYVHAKWASGMTRTQQLGLLTGVPQKGDTQKQRLWKLGNPA